MTFVLVAAMGKSKQKHRAPPDAVQCDSNAAGEQPSVRPGTASGNKPDAASSKAGAALYREQLATLRHIFPQPVGPIAKWIAGGPAKLLRTLKSYASELKQPVWLFFLDELLEGLDRLLEKKCPSLVIEHPDVRFYIAVHWLLPLVQDDRPVPLAALAFAALSTLVQDEQNLLAELHQPPESGPQPLHSLLSPPQQQQQPPQQPPAPPQPAQKPDRAAKRTVKQLRQQLQQLEQGAVTPHTRPRGPLDELLDALAPDIAAWLQRPGLIDALDRLDAHEAAPQLALCLWQSAVPREGPWAAAAAAVLRHYLPLVADADTPVGKLRPCARLPLLLQDLLWNAAPVAEVWQRLQADHGLNVTVLRWCDRIGAALDAADAAAAEAAAAAGSQPAASHQNVGQSAVGQVAAGDDQQYLARPGQSKRQGAALLAPPAPQLGKGGGCAPVLPDRGSPAASSSQQPGCSVEHAAEPAGSRVVSGDGSACSSGGVDDSSAGGSGCQCAECSGDTMQDLVSGVCACLEAWRLLHDAQLSSSSSGGANHDSTSCALATVALERMVRHIDDAADMVYHLNFCMISLLHWAVDNAPAASRAALAAEATRQIRRCCAAVAAAAAAEQPADVAAIAGQLAVLVSYVATALEARPLAPRSAASVDMRLLAPLAALEACRIWREADPGVQNQPPPVQLVRDMIPSPDADAETLGVHAAFASDSLAAKAAITALQVLNPGAVAALGSHPAEYLASCGFFAGMAAFLWWPPLPQWNGTHLDAHRTVSNAVAAAAGWLESKFDATGEQPSELLVSGVAICNVAVLHRLQQPLPRAKRALEAELAFCGRALWSACEVLCNMLRRPQWRRLVLAAGALPAIVAALRWFANTQIPFSDAGDTPEGVMAALASLAGGGEAEVAVFKECAADWVEFVDLLKTRAPRLADELEDHLVTVSAVIESLGDQRQHSSRRNIVSVLLQS